MEAASWGLTLEKVNNVWSSEDVEGFVCDKNLEFDPELEASVVCVG